MINVIQTLKNLNKAFPRFQLETLLKIVECIQEYPENNTTTTWPPTWIHTYDSTPDVPIHYNTVTCNQNCAKTFTNDNTPVEAFIYTTTTKNHAADKTSNNQVITSEGEEASDLSTLEDWLRYQKTGTAFTSTYEPKHRS